MLTLTLTLTLTRCYSLVAHDMLAALVKSTQCTDEMQGFGSRLTPFPQARAALTLPLTLPLTSNP